MNKIIIVKFCTTTTSECSTKVLVLALHSLRGHYIEQQFTGRNTSLSLVLPHALYHVELIYVEHAGEKCCTEPGTYLVLTIPRHIAACLT